MKEILNPNIEIRNKFKIRMSQGVKKETKQPLFWSFEFQVLCIVSYFGLPRRDLVGNL